MTFIASRGSVFGYAVDINMALGTEGRVTTEHPSLSPRGGGLRNKKGGPEVEKSGLIIFGPPPPSHQIPDPAGCQLSRLCLVTWGSEETSARQFGDQPDGAKMLLGLF